MGMNMVLCVEMAENFCSFRSVHVPVLLTVINTAEMKGMLFFRYLCLRAVYARLSMKISLWLYGFLRIDAFAKQIIGNRIVVFLWFEWRTQCRRDVAISV